jgi:DNA-binding Lrp family transcriptional regulator
VSSSGDESRCHDRETAPERQVARSLGSIRRILDLFDRHRLEATLMITAIVLVHVESDRIPEVAESIADLDGVSEVYSVTGGADLIAMVRVREHEALADVIADRLSKVSGVRATETHIAFRTYSKHDLDAAFSLGVEDPD